MRKSNYSLSETIYNIRCVIFTKLLFNKARLIRTPITIRGKKYIDFGKGLTTGTNCQIEVNGNHDEYCLSFGDCVNIGHNVRIQCYEKISIGNHVLMGSRITIIDHSHGSYDGEFQDPPTTHPNDRELKSNSIEIGDNVWIGDGVIIQAGVSIGKGCIIGANSVVTKSVPDECIVGVIPAHIIKRYNPETGKWDRF